MDGHQTPDTPLRRATQGQLGEVFLLRKVQPLLCSMYTSSKGGRRGPPYPILGACVRTYPTEHHHSSKGHWLRWETERGHGNLTVPCTLHIVPYTLHIVNCTLHIVPCTLHVTMLAVRILAKADSEIDVNPNMS